MANTDWLINKDYIKSLGYSDTYYLESLCYKVFSFIKNVPVPIVCKYNHNLHKINYHLGKEYVEIPVDSMISPYDHVFQVKMYFKKFFPSFDVKISKEVELTEDEMIALINKGMDTNDVINQRKTVVEHEVGTIVKIYLKRDSFLLERNNILEYRVTGSLKNLLGCSEFMRNIRACKDDMERYNYIMNNSRFEYHVKEDTIDINYPGQMMKNFFKIHAPYMNSEILWINEYVAEWEGYRITFDSLFLKQDCMTYLQCRKKYC